MLTIITLPVDFVADITATMSGFFTDLSGYTTLIIGVSLGMIVIGFLIRAMTK
jgi:hypothetical protein